MNITTRRDFLKTGVTLGAAFSLADLGGLFASDAAPVADLKLDAAGKPYLVAVRKGSRAAMLDAALKALGGIERFVKKGQTVVIKPNAAWDVAPERSANTHPELMGRLVEHCVKAGAKSVSVFDHTCDHARDSWGGTCYVTSGIRAAVEKAGGKMAAGNDEHDYRTVSIPNGVALKETKVHKLLLDSDVFINVPVLKHHGGATVTIAMKNLMGAMWDRRFYHSHNLHQCIADYISVPKLRPALNILDAYAPMVRNGPRGKSVDDVLQGMESLLASTDIVALDAAGARLLGHAEDEIPHVKIASDSGYGTCRLKNVKIERIALA
ncbi:MAG: DUF362 domain-containing protein [Puniceicoccales bacterium]|jgi:uncharacterized protein (DUF362 family)|nr:DUF362 domain-containing protein [Puniceicoccales bacterium]